jgi:hypothetical protein
MRRLAFLRRLLARFDADLQMVGTALHVSPRADVRRAQLTLSVEADLRSVNVCADLAEQVTSLSVRGWDAVQGSAVVAELRQGTHLGPGQGRAGSALLSDSATDNLSLAVRTEAGAGAGGRVRSPRPPVHAYQRAEKTNHPCRVRLTGLGAR